MQPAPSSPDARHYRYDPNFGDRRATYRTVDFESSPNHQPEIAAIFVAYVEGETIISTIHGRHTVAWRAEPGTPCLILGWWSDGTVHVKWPAIAGHYTIDGRFPAWVVAEDPSAAMAGGGRILIANDPPPRRPPVPEFLIAAVVLCAVFVVLLLVPATREALGALLHLGR
jgi:hypothetical protein